MGLLKGRTCEGVWTDKELRWLGMWPWLRVTGASRTGNRLASVAPALWEHLLVWALQRNSALRQILRAFAVKVPVG